MTGGRTTPAARIAAAAAAALLAAVPLAGCGEKAERGEAGETGAVDERTLAVAIADAPGLTTVAGALTEAGLAGVFDGPGSYTLLAPDDDAFARLEGQVPALGDPARRAELVAILRGHVLPGHLTPDAIRQAIAARKGPVTVTNLADGLVTFTAEGDSLTVTGADGSKARLSGTPLVVSNGVVLPLDGVIKQAGEGQAARE
ncbi:MAG: fasciclin domain-containing protein [Cypionkella sp.]